MAMPGRLTMVAVDELENRFGASPVEEFFPRYNIAPEDDVLAVRNDAPTEITLLRWGFLPDWSGKTNLKNARAESIDEKQSFKESFESRRCLVLVDGFYEWKGPKGSKQPYRIVRADGKPFAIAGIWKTQAGQDDEPVKRTVLITTEPNETVKPIHDRMPAILDPDGESAWLATGDPEAHKDLLKPCPDGVLRAYPVSTAVNNPSNDSPEVIEEVRDPQSGLGDFA